MRFKKEVLDEPASPEPFARQDAIPRDLSAGKSTARRTPVDWQRYFTSFAPSHAT